MFSGEKNYYLFEQHFVQGITTGGEESSQFPGDAVHNNHTKSQKLPTQQLQLLGFQTDKVVPSTGEDP